MKRTPFFSKAIIVGLAALAAGNLGWAQSVTVNSDGGADYTTIGAALDAVGSDAAEPNVITITGGGPYEEGILIDIPITIRGESADDRPIVLLKQVGGSVRGEHGVVNTAAVDITLENLIFIPSTAEPLTKRAICFEPLADSDDFDITIRNVLVSANDGSNQPLSVDGMELMFPSAENSVPFQDDGIWVLASFYRPNGTIDVLLEDVIVTHCDSGKDPDMITANSDGFVIGGINMTFTMRNVVSSYNDRYGIQIISADVDPDPVTYTPIANLEGTPEQPIIFKGNGSQGIQSWTGENHWSYVHLIENPQGVRIDVYSNTLEADHLLFVDSTEAINLYRYPPTEDEVLYQISDSTFFRSSETDILINPTVDDAAILNQYGAFTMELTDCVVAGTMVFLVNSTLEVIPEGFTEFPTVIYKNSALVEEGDHSVFVDFEGIPVNPVLENTIGADPEFVSIEPGNDGYLRVSADAYRTAASDGGILRGAMPFAGEPVPVRDWMMYE